MNQKIVIAFDAEPTEEQLALAKSVAKQFEQLGASVELIGTRPKTRG